VIIEQECPAKGCRPLRGHVAVTLTRPLGDRLVLDSGTGLPVVRGVT
jgi:hypothetical protein